MSTTLDQSVVATLYDQLVSHAESLGVFDAGVNPAEPWSTPGSGTWCAFAAPSVLPTGAASGLAQVTARLEFKALVAASALLKPVGRADKLVLVAAAALMGAYAGGFTLAGNVRNIDLLGAHGTPLSASPAYMTMEGHTFRVMEVVIPLIVNDVFGEVA